MRAPWGLMAAYLVAVVALEAALESCVADEQRIVSDSTARKIADEDFCRGLLATSHNAQDSTTALGKLLNPSGCYTIIGRQLRAQRDGSTVRK